GPAALAWVGSLLVLGGGVHLLRWAEVRQPWLAAVLAHGTLALAAGLALRRAGEREPLPRVASALAHSALASSFLAVPLLLTHKDVAMAWPWTTWLAALWLALAWVRRWPVLFAAFQAMLGVTVVLGLIAWRGVPEVGVSGLSELQVHAAG